MTDRASRQITIVEATVASDPIIVHREALLRLPDVTRFTGLGRSAIYERMGQGTFPMARDLGGNAVAWSAGEVLDWIKALPRVMIRPPKPRTVR